MNLTTGVVDAMVANTVYTDKQLAVYQVDQVLLPLDLFGLSSSPAPAPSQLEKTVPVSAPKGSSSAGASVDSSIAASLNCNVLAMASTGIAILAAASFWL